MASSPRRLVQRLWTARPSRCSTEAICAALVMLTVGNLAARPATAQLIEPRIIGTWEWVSTQIEGQATITPETAGHSEQWEFALPAIYRHYRNGHRQFVSTFDVSEIVTEENFLLVLSISGRGDYDLRQVDDSTLVLVGTGSPSFDTWTFQRRGPVPTPTRTLGELKQTYAD